MKLLPYAKLGLFGATVGPLVDSIHNQVLLQYDVLPIEALGLKTSLLIPPLLCAAYVVLGGLLPQLARRFIGDEKRLLGDPQPFADQPQLRALIAVLSTCVIIKLSEVLTASAISNTITLLLLTLLALVQFVALDGAYSSLFIATIAGLGGPLAELPFTFYGAWHYINPDYFPLDFLAPSGHESLGLSSITGPCYAVVTTDAIALGKAFGVGHRQDKSNRLIGETD